MFPRRGLRTTAYLWKSGLFLTILLLSLSGIGGSSSPADDALRTVADKASGPNSTSITAPPLSLLRQETSRLLREQATAKESSANARALESLCDLYAVLRTDTRYGESEMLQQDAAKIRRRLLTVARDESNRLQRNGVPKQDTLATQVDRAIGDALAKHRSASSQSTDPDAKSNSDSQSGSGSDPQQGAFAAGMMNNGWELIELIQRTVQPDFWDTQGGPGSIGYFAMRRVLVVRATSDVHQQIQDLLRTLTR
ncbi:hypothetical protein Pla52n_45920 [Stieleria varia]|uniref:Uncharacterized protein n=2 Tax=Stieleria varia TaxID=2528005 RepID=A0A5C6ANH0_9BACT|nr:hypothetical protein Pla52n_45920 [Stieleria varia]